jgi:hypothetical protein
MLASTERERTKISGERGDNTYRNEEDLLREAA